MSDKELRKLVYSLLDPHLRSHAEQERFRSIVNLKQWSDALALEDCSIRTEAAFFRASKASKGHCLWHGTAANGRVKPPALTSDERELLKEHDGCFVCREFYVGHKSSNCTGKYPDGSNYTELMVDDAQSAAAKRGKAFNTRGKSASTSTAKGKGKAVAAAIVDEVDDIEEVGVAALADSLNYESDSDVSVPCLLAPPLHWQGLVWDSDNVPSFCSNCLLDCGSQLVLVSEDFVHRTGLQKFPLSRPIHITVAIPEIPDSAIQLSSKSKVVYRFGVSITVSSPDNRWSAKEITAVLVPCLLDNCDIILGLLWLTSNRIVMDFENCSAIAKSCGYDLLKPIALLPTNRKAVRRWSCHELSSLKHNFHDMLLELCAVVWHQNLTSPCDEERRGAVAAITARIVTLNEKKEMAELHKRIMSEYADVFGPVPHVDVLPEHEFCRVKLKDEEVALDSRSYPSPPVMGG
ncbi:hypothetical protein H1R20_g15404, partial [Candolleomyces eurysporus]